MQQPCLCPKVYQVEEEQTGVSIRVTAMRIFVGVDLMVATENCRC